MPEKLDTTPFCYILQDDQGKLRYPVKFRAPAERCQQNNEVILELYVKEPHDDEAKK